MQQTNTRMEKFEAELAQSKKIEALFRQHRKFPFLNQETQIDDEIWLRLFWRYMARPYVNAFLNEKWQNWSLTHMYASFTEAQDDDVIPDSPLDFYGLNSRRWLQIHAVGAFEDRWNDNHFSINTGLSHFLSERSENPADDLYFLSMAVDLRHPDALEMARDFMYAFFVEQLPVEKMKAKMAQFDAESAHKFERGVVFEPIQAGNGDYSAFMKPKIAPEHPYKGKRFVSGENCPCNGVWQVVDSEKASLVWANPIQRGLAESKFMVKGHPFPERLVRHTKPREVEVKSGLFSKKTVQEFDYLDRVHWVLSPEEIENYRG